MQLLISSQTPRRIFEVWIGNVILYFTIDAITFHGGIKVKKMSFSIELDEFNRRLLYSNYFENFQLYV